MTVSTILAAVMICGPSDTEHHVGVVRDVIHKWNSSHSLHVGVTFVPQHYSSDAVPVYREGADGQIIINEQIAEKADVFIGLFMHRLGRPTPRNEYSASVEEIELGKDTGPHVYFWDGDVPADVANNPEKFTERQRLREFRAAMESEGKGLYGTFKTDDDLAEQVERALWLDARRIRSGQPITAPESETPSDLDNLKKALAERNPIAVSELTREVVQKITAAMRDRERFPPHWTASSAKGRLAEYLGRARGYRQVVEPLLQVLIVGCRWGEAEYERIWADAVQTLARTPRPADFTVPDLQSLALLPATLAIYAGSVAAVDAGQYGPVRALTTDATLRRSAHDATLVPVIMRADPWSAFFHETQYAQTVLADQDPMREMSDEIFDAIARNQFRVRGFPASTYLYYSLRSTFADLDEDRYEEKFDETEILFTLIASDLAIQQSNLYFEPWYGRFVRSIADSYHFDQSFVGQYLAGALQSGGDWPPLRGGIFGGSASRVAAATERIVPEIQDEGRRRI